MLTIEKFRITRENIYNIDKKKSLIDMIFTLIWLMTDKKLRSDEIIGGSQDSNRKWVLLLATICIIVFTLPLALIYQRESINLKNK